MCCVHTEPSSLQTHRVTPVTMFPPNAMQIHTFFRSQCLRLQVSVVSVFKVTGLSGVCV